MPQEFRPREKPKVSLIATLPALGEQKPISALDQVVSLWGSRSVSCVTVITPFVGKPNGEDDKVVQRLAVLPRTRDCEGWLVAPRRPGDETDSLVRVALPASFGKAWERCFQPRGGSSRILAVPEFVKGIDKVNRMLHSKVLSLESDDHEFLMIGSSNFTPHGMGIGVFNVEANLLFEDASEAWSRIELPLAWEEAKQVNELQWDEQYEPAEDCVDQASMLPRFFACASYFYCSNSSPLV